MSSEPESNAPQESPQPQPKKPLLPPSRIAFLIFVVAAAVVIVIEFRARLNFNANYQAVGAAMTAADEKNEALVESEIADLLKGTYTREADRANSELFTWEGLLKSYRMRVYYGSEKRVELIERE